MCESSSEKYSYDSDDTHYSVEAQYYDSDACRCSFKTAPRYRIKNISNFKIDEVCKYKKKIEVRKVYIGSFERRLKMIQKRRIKREEKKSKILNENI